MNRAWTSRSLNAALELLSREELLGEGRFAALTSRMQAQLRQLAAVSEPHRGGRRVHGLAAPALDAVLEGAGGAESDAAWKRHVARIRNAEGWAPRLPPTLQAELRDYQVDGSAWISRLARWGLPGRRYGLGKTVQAMARSCWTAQARGRA